MERNQARGEHGACQSVGRALRIGFPCANTQKLNPIKFAEETAYWQISSPIPDRTSATFPLNGKYILLFAPPASLFCLPVVKPQFQLDRGGLTQPLYAPVQPSGTSRRFRMRILPCYEVRRTPEAGRARVHRREFQSRRTPDEALE